MELDGKIRVCENSKAFNEKLVNLIGVLRPVKELDNDRHTFLKPAPRCSDISKVRSCTLIKTKVPGRSLSYAIQGGMTDPSESTTSRWRSLACASWKRGLPKSERTFGS